VHIHIPGIPDAPYQTYLSCGNHSTSRLKARPEYESAAIERPVRRAEERSVVARSARVVGCGAIVDWQSWMFGVASLDDV
jgi:hypothetical protein